MSWYYTQTEPGLWTVCHDTRTGPAVTDLDFVDRDEARARVHYLNGGVTRVAITRPEVEEAIAAAFLAHDRQGHGP